jgi:hypothetical protein
MHGVPVDLPISRFVGCTLDQISIGEHQLLFHFSGEGGLGGGSISVEGGWELRDSEGTVIDSAREHAERADYRIHVIISRTVSRFTIDAPRSFTVFFDSQHRLTVYDDSDRYETFSVIPRGETGVHI